MGQSKWAGACALVLACSIAARLSADDEAENPFGAEHSPGAEVGQNLGEAERRIERVLDQPLKSPLQFPQTPLNTVMGLIADEFDIPIVFDTAALDAVAVSPDIEVDIDIANVSLRSALDLMLKQVEDLTYIVDNEVLLITTEDDANTRLEVRVYRVDDLVREGGAAGAIDEDRFETLHDIILATVERDSWSINKTGEGEILRFAPGMLVIGQTHRVHEQIGDLLTEIRKVKAEIEVESPEAATAPRPIARAFKVVSQDFTGTPESRDALRKALAAATQWDSSQADVGEDEVFLEVLPNRVLVRHLPSVVRAVERTLVALDATKQRDAGVAAFQRQQQEQRPRRGGF